jgi:glutathione S-transferase
MAQYKLHCVGASGNSYKVALYLNFAGLDWESVGVDFGGGQTREANWRATTNAMGEVPVLEVTGKRMAQSGAILMWLAETTGKFAPANADERFEAMRWILFDNHKFTGSFAPHRIQYSFTPEPPHPAVLSFLRTRAESAFSIVDKHLTDRSFVLGDRPTIADFLAGWLPVLSTGGDRLRSRGRLSGYPCLVPARCRTAGLEPSVRADAAGRFHANARGLRPMDLSRSFSPIITA